MEKLFLSTSRIVIRNLQPADHDDFYFYRSNPDVTKYQGFDVMTIEQSKGFIESQKDKLFGKLGEWVQYGIEDKALKKLIGDCAVKLDEYDGRIAEIGITISHTQQRKGYAKEVLTTLINFLFELPNFHRITEIVDTENTASIRLLESLGFSREGHFIENRFFNGKWGSEMQYALLRREWEISAVHNSLQQ